MDLYSKICLNLSNGVLHVARIALAALGLVVIAGVVTRYVFNNEPAYIEQVALLLVISVAMFGAAAGVRDSGHIGLDSVVKLLPKVMQRGIQVLVEIIIFVFASVLIWGSFEMSLSTLHDTIPTLGISEAFRYLPVLLAGILVILFSIEHLLQFALQKSEKN
jgi:TRAP-type C4-dicarboxylate transport system permease small subunit